MKGYLSKAGMVALIALMMASQGCLVPWKKYITLKRKYEEAIRELAAKDSQLADANTRIDNLRDQLKAKDQLIALYEEKYKDAGLLAQKAREDLDRLTQKVNELKGLGEGIEVVGNTVIMPDKLLFPLGSAEVSEAGRKILEEVASRFKGGTELLQIDGHTDDVRVARPDTVRKFEDNFGLAAFRAKAVLNILAKGGIAENRMYLRAFSMYRPRLPNTNDASRSKNRRVEIMFFPPEALGPKAEEPKPEAPKPEAPKAEAPTPGPATPAETK
jgi:chemotaxis protein MotB